MEGGTEQQDIKPTLGGGEIEAGLASDCFDQCYHDQLNLTNLLIKLKYAALQFPQYCKYSEKLAQCQSIPGFIIPRRTSGIRF